MPTTLQKLSPGEFETLKLLWKLESATVAEVRAAYGSASSRPAYTTIMTVLGRLVEKEAVRVDKNRQPFRYRPAIRRDTLLRLRLREFLQVCYEGDGEHLMEDLVGQGHVSLAAARRLLQEGPDAEG